MIELKRINKRLKANKMPVALFLRGDRIWIRATFPPKPKSDKTKPYQQVFTLGLPVNPLGLKEAEQRAKLIGSELITGRFRWENWQEEKEDREAVGSWIKKFEQHYWKKRKKTPQSLHTWELDYYYSFKKLPMDQDLTEKLLLKVALESEPDSRTRRKLCEKFSQLAKFAGLPYAELLEIKGKYSAKTVSPKELPSDDWIVTTRNQIKHPGWQWVFGMMAAYGLRNHEVFLAILDEFPLIRIPENTKTGVRFVMPLYPEWADEWDLGNRILPKVTYNNRDIGNRVVVAFKRQGVIGHTPYALRHCYARRCVEFGIPPDQAAKMMGHSITVHMNTYRRWIDEDVYLRSYKKAIEKSDRPVAPQ